jgi:Na+/melibiose symporter-like transporter
MERVSTPTFEEKVSAVSVFLVIALPLAVVICLFSMPERQVPPQPSLGFKKGLSILLGNKAVYRVLLANALLGFSGFFVQGLFVFFVSYTLNLADRIGFILLFLIIGGLISVPVWIKLSARLGKHKTLQVAVFIGTLAPLLLLVLPTDAVVLTAIAFTVIGVNSSANEFLPRAMMADVCDYDSVTSGSERMALYYSLLQLSSKLVAGLGIFVGFSFLTFFGFYPELGKANTAEAIQNLRYLIVALPVAAHFIVIALMWRYPITREHQRDMQRILEERGRKISSSA